MKAANTAGMWLDAPAASDTKVGRMPPSAKPTFHDRPVPVARSAVGKLSLR